MAINHCTHNSQTKQKTYKHLNRAKRHRLSIYLAKGVNIRDCAGLLNVSPSTVSREVKRGQASKSCRYNYRSSQKRAKVKRELANQQHRKLYFGSDTEALIRYYLRRYYSPEQMVGAGLLDICPDTIYRWLKTLDSSQLQELQPYLRHKAKRRKAGTKARLKLQRQAKKRNISTRPDIIETRTQLGHWEGDTMVGSNKKTRLVTLVERRSGYLLSTYIPSAQKEVFAEACVSLFKPIKTAGRLSLTLDNGSEMNDFKTIEKRLRLTVYFADPYASYQRGSNENTNGLLRQFFPKGSDFRDIPSKQLAKVVSLINNRPQQDMGLNLQQKSFKNT